MALDVRAPTQRPAVPVTEATATASGRGATPPTVKRGDRGPAVEQLQREMKAKGVYKGPVTGYFGNITNAAVRDFQKNHGLVVDGIVGPKTWGKLKSLPQAGGNPGSAPVTPSKPPAAKPGSGEMFPPPVGYKQLVDRFGKPGTNIVTAKLPLGPGGKEVNVQLHAKMVPIMKSVLAEAKDKGLLKHITKFDGMAVEPRLKRRPDGTPLVPHQYSVHSWGVAFDINANAKGGHVDKALVDFMKSKGFTWGGDFKKNYDPMHFQYASGY
ncbi:MAG TPA: M15 family metallopeptidase [Myxococcaceae bacterium]|nr:M15 family metallopeptidase [Myxococcaceae bacterium]